MPAYELSRRDGRLLAYRLRADGKRTAGKPLEVCPRCFDADRGGGIISRAGDMAFCTAGCGYLEVRAEPEGAATE